MKKINHILGVFILFLLLTTPITYADMINDQIIEQQPIKIQDTI